MPLEVDQSTFSKALSQKNPAMGQYYLVLNLAKQQFLKPETCRKLMDHSFLEDPMVKCFFNLIASDWKFDKCVWLGDYAERPEVPFKDVEEQFEELALETLKPVDRIQGQHFVCEEAKEFVNLTNYLDAHKGKGPDGRTISPTLLLVDGNGRGKGDYSGQGDVGRWAYSDIALTEKPPKNYKEILPAYNWDGAMEYERA